MNNTYITITDFLLHKVINSTIKKQAVCCVFKVLKVRAVPHGLLRGITLPCKTLLRLVNHSYLSKGMVVSR